MTTAITPHVPAHAALAPFASRLVDVDALPWQPTRFAGIECRAGQFIWRPAGSRHSAFPT